MILDMRETASLEYGKCEYVVYFTNSVWFDWSPMLEVEVSVEIKSNLIHTAGNVIRKNYPDSVMDKFEKLPIF